MYKLDEKGQTIAAIFMIMILALSVGVATSTRFIKTLKLTTRVGSSNRALSVAEAAVENLLVKSYEDLLEYIQFDSCGADCVFQIVGDDGVISTATVVLSIVGESSDTYLVNLVQDDVAEVSLDGYPDNTDLAVCWNNPSSGDKPSVVGALLYGNDGGYEISNFAYNSIGSLYNANGFMDTIAANGYGNCLTVTGSINPKLLRLRSIYNDIEASVLPNSGSNLPTQGILMTATGVTIDAIKTIRVIRSSPHVPALFDFALFSTSLDTPLSN